MDALHSRDHSFVDESIRMAVELNCNMIRCWGGNVYEDHHSLIYAMKTALWYGRILRWDALSILNAAHLHKHWKKRPFPLYASYAIIHHSFYGQEIMKTNCALRWSLQPFNINPNQDVVSRKVLPAVIYEFDPTRLIFPALLTTAKRYMKEEVLTNIYQKTIYGVPEDITKTNSIRMLPAALSVKSAITAA